MHSLIYSLQQELGNFFSTAANPTTTLPGVINLAKNLRDGGVKKLYIYGLCWGGKIATLTGTHTMNVDGNSLPVVDATAALHPAYVGVYTIFMSIF
jgi:dienelactone hydrolase